MNFNKKTLVGVSSVLVLTLVLGMSSVSRGNSDPEMIDRDYYGIQLSAGANAAIAENGNNTVAGANGALDEIVGVVDIENSVVGQGPEVEEEKPVYETFGYTNLGLADVKGNLNIRKEPSVTSTIVGKMTKYAAC